MKVWVVKIADCDGSSIKHICKTKELAEKRLFEERDRLVSRWKEVAKMCGREDYSDRIKNLSNSDYKNWDNYPHDTPFMYEMELEEEA